MVDTPVKILMVCLGNICRSPMAQGVMENVLENHGINAFVDSAGTAAYHSGEAPDVRGQREMRKHAIDISHQRARQFQVADFDHFDYIFTMDRSNYNHVMALAASGEDRSKVRMMMDVVDPGNATDVPDPYYGGDSGFANVYRMLNEAAEAIVATEL